MRQRWVVFVAALAGSALLAAGFAVVAGRVTATNGPAPQLRGISASSLAAAGYTLGAAALPPYCDAELEAAGRGCLPAGAAGCPVPRSAAEATAAPSGTAQVVESLLARVSATGTTGTVSRDRLMWLVVVRPRMLILPMIACAGGPAVTVPCPPQAAVAGTVLVMVDAHSGQTVYAVMLGATGAAVPWRPRQGPTPTAPPIAIQPVQPVHPVARPTPPTG